jgi:hypothetical protein
MRLRLLLLVVTAGFEGLRAGAGTFRALLDLPARSTIGPLAFAELSRATDLSPVGIAFYALYGVGGLAFTGTTFWAFLRSKAERSILMLLGVSVACSVLILVLTVEAAPLMWSIGSAPDDPATLGPLIEPFVFWTNLRIGLADISFVAMLAAAWKMMRGTAAV